jgi:phytoene desaturase
MNLSREKMAPEGCTVVIVQYDGDYDRWKSLLADPNAYKAEKARILTETIRALEVHFPGIESRIEASDVATPTTCEGYTGNWRGCIIGWITTIDLMKKFISGERFPKVFKEVKDFHLIGQWTEPAGGLPPTAKTGRDVVRVIMKAEGRKAAR